MADGGIMDDGLHGIVPGPDTQRAFRDVLGRFATGVTVVTAQTPDGPVGITANSFSSLSMDPPLVMWCPAKASSRYPVFSTATHFAIHVLGREHAHVASAFARSAHAFEGLGLQTNENGVPLFDECVARFECETAQRHDGGDHLIVIGHVLNAAAREGDTLVFSRGRFGGFLDS